MPTPYFSKLSIFLSVRAIRNSCGESCIVSKLGVPVRWIPSTYKVTLETIFKECLQDRPNTSFKVNKILIKLNLNNLMIVVNLFDD